MEKNRKYFISFIYSVGGEQVHGNGINTESPKLDSMESIREIEEEIRLKILKNQNVKVGFVVITNFIEL